MNYLTYLLESDEILGEKRVSSEMYGQLLNNMQRVMALTPAIFANSRANQSEIVLVQCALNHVKESGENITVAQAAKLLGVPMPSVSRTLKSLSQKGFIERYSDPTDRRAVRIKVTAAGENEIKKLFTHVTSIFDKAMCGFSDEEIATMVNLHGRFVNEVSAAVAAEAKQPTGDS